MRLHYQVGHFFANMIAYGVLGTEVRSVQHLNGWSGGIVAANHLSYLDPPVLASVLPFESRFLAKKELFRHPLFGRLIRSFGAIPIDRDGFDRRAIQDVIQRLQAGSTIIIFPEGSRSRFTARPGIGMIARKAEVPVLPVYLDGTRRWRDALLHRDHITIQFGKPFTREDVQSYPDRGKGYRSLANDILERINGLS